MIELVFGVVGLALKLVFGLVGLVLGLVFGAVGLVFSAVFWVALIAGTVLVVRALSRPRARERVASVPLSRRTLDERYVRGEIDRDEYLERRALMP